MPVSVCDSSRWVVSHAYSLFDSETLTHSESLGGREFLRDFGSLYFFPFGAFFRLSLESSKSGFQVNGSRFYSIQWIGTGIDFMY